MIIVQLRGGLGNQLFQYAAGLSLGLHHNVEVRVDIGHLKKSDDGRQTFREFELEYLQNPPVVATEMETAAVVHSNSIKRYWEKFLPPHRRIIYKESSFAFDPHFLKAGNNIYLKGYRQSEKYFHPIGQFVTDQFLFQRSLTQHLALLAQRLRSINSVAVHIRRGDYLNKTSVQYHGTLGQTYYQSAINMIEHKEFKPAYFIFSNDVEWVKKNLMFPRQVEYVSGELTNNHYEDFYLMSQCRHNIIANSSFSWWAAWLNINPQKKVISPKNWFNNARLSTKDLIPKDWTIL